MTLKGHNALCFKTRASLGTHHEHLSEDIPILSRQGAPAGFQARVGKHFFDKIRRKNFFVCPPWFSVCPPCHTQRLPILPTVVHWYRHRVWRDNLVWLRYEKLPTLTVLPAIARQSQYFAPENYLTLNKCSFHINKCIERYQQQKGSLWRVNNIEVTLYHAHKLLTTILSLTNYYQEVFRPRLKFPGWGPPWFFPGWASAHVSVYIATVTLLHVLTSAYARQRLPISLDQQVPACPLSVKIQRQTRGFHDIDDRPLTPTVAHLRSSSRRSTTVTTGSNSKGDNRNDDDEDSRQYVTKPAPLE